MKYETIKKLGEKEFRRLTGVKRQTFEKMASLLDEAKRKQKARGGKPNSLIIEDQLLMMLAYWREYRTYFHIGQTYGKSESQTYRIIKWCEDTLSKSKIFRLPGRKATASLTSDDIVLIDVTETPIERPKKTKKLLLREKETTYTKNAASDRKKDTAYLLYFT